MRSTGQSALDLLLGLLVLLIVLNVFSSVLARFEEVQKEISVRQQLRENASLVALFSTYAGNYFFEPHLYPQTNSVPPAGLLSVRWNAYTRSYGIIDLETIRSPSVQTTPSCVLNNDINGRLLTMQFLVDKTSAGLSKDVNVNRTANIRSTFDQNHLFLIQGCMDSFSIEALP